MTLISPSRLMLGMVMERLYWAAVLCLGRELDLLWWPLPGPGLCLVCLAPSSLSSELWELEVTEPLWPLRGAGCHLLLSSSLNVFIFSVSCEILWQFCRGNWEDSWEVREGRNRTGSPRIPWAENLFCKARLSRVMARLQAVKLHSKIARCTPHCSQHHSLVFVINKTSREETFKGM